MIVDPGRQRSAEHANRARVDQARLSRERAAGLEDVAGAVEVDAHPEREIILRRAAHDTREMEHHTGAGIDESRHECGIADVAPHGLDARVGCISFGEHAVGENQAAYGKRLILRIAEFPARGKRARKSRSDEAGSPGYDDLHTVPRALSRPGIGSADLMAVAACAAGGQRSARQNTRRSVMRALC